MADNYNGLQLGDGLIGARPLPRVAAESVAALVEEEVERRVATAVSLTLETLAVAAVQIANSELQKAWVWHKKATQDDDPKAREEARRNQLIHECKAEGVQMLARKMIARSYFAEGCSGDLRSVEFAVREPRADA